MEFPDEIASPAPSAFCGIWWAGKLATRAAESLNLPRGGAVEFRNDFRRLMDQDGKSQGPSQGVRMIGT
jgi:hypothetical protein